MAVSECLPLYCTPLCGKAQYFALSGRRDAQPLFSINQRDSDLLEDTSSPPLVFLSGGLQNSRELVVVFGGEGDANSELFSVPASLSGQEETGTEE
jgi:hypothetical protein